MPGWVLPAVAAELWGVTVEQVMADVAAGRINSRAVGEFVFVDVQPAGGGDDEDEPQDAPEVIPSTYRRSLAWSVPPSPEPAAESIMADPIVTAEERDALMDEPATHQELEETWGPVDEPDADAAVDAPDEPIVLTAEDIPNWGEVRARVARTRRPPRRILDAA